ncbi:MAG: protein-glutamate O-methyltransferase CheR [Myxococcota bacterium]|nr:protein-glutamate O-methyltransferase CheR [Myxococcota bacterium]
MEPAELAKVLTVVASRTGIDFRDYRPETLARGVAQRLVASRSKSVDAYVERLMGTPGEVAELTRAFLVPVTEFFRDAPVFQALATIVLPSFLWVRHPRQVLRVWSIGTATGEEAWSIAMLLEIGRQIYGYSDYEVVATDLDPTSLAIAERGVYQTSALANIPEPLRSQFLIKNGDLTQIAPSLRPRVHFVSHDVVGRVLAPTRAVVASFDIILLRNVLIYFDRRLQEKALERVRSVIEDDGALVLGMVETLPVDLEAHFEVFPDTDAAHRIFRRRREVLKP